MALYTVTLTNVTRGWAYTSTEGVEPNPADAVQLADDLAYLWSFTDAQVPGHLEPMQLGCRLWCHTAADVPLVDRGDELRLDVRLGTVGARLVQSPAMYVTTVDVDTDVPPGVGPESYTTLVQLRAADDTAQLPSFKPQPRAQLPGGGVYYWGGVPVPVGQLKFRHQLTEIGQQIGRSVGIPSWWSTDPVNLLQTGNARTRTSWTENARQLFDRTLNDRQPGWINHTLVPALGAAYPAGYATAHYALVSGDPWTGVTDPLTAQRLLCVPAGRRTRNQAWPARLAVRSGQVTIQPNAAGTQDGHDAVGVRAEWCDLPVKARRAREHVVNAVELQGWQNKWTYLTNPDPQTGSRVKVEEVDVSWFATDIRAGEQANIRPVPIWTNLGDTSDSTYGPGQTPVPSPGPYAASEWKTFMADDSQRAAWAYDAFTLHASRVPADLQSVVLPRLAPRIPGEADGNGHVLKHLTLYRVAPQARFKDAPGPVQGFVVSGQLRIVRGDVVYTFVLTPGLPLAMDSGYTDTSRATPVTVAQVDGGTYQAQLCNTIDPLIRVSDLAYISS